MFVFKLLNIEEAFGDKVKVNSPKLKDKRNNDGSSSNSRGLFSEVVFGPTRDYQCSCGRYKGIMCQGQTCEVCGVTVQSSSARRFTFGKIELGDKLYLVNPVAFKLLLNNCILDKNLRNIAMNVLLGKVGVDKITGEITTSVTNQFTGPIAFKESIYPDVVKHIKAVQSDHIINEVLPMIDDCLFTKIIPVVPPDLRPITSGNGSTCFIDELNKVYMIMLNYVKFINESPVIPYDKLALLQNQYFILSEMLLKKLSSKSGIMRKYILGKRVDYSGRAVIVPDPTLDVQEVDVSFHIVKEVFKPALLPKLAQKLDVSELEALNRCYDSALYEDILFDLCQEYIGYPAILNRQPTLHRPSIMVFYVRKVLRDYVIAIPPIATEPFNADFDGDQMAIYFPIGGAAFNESVSLTPSNNMYLPSNGELAFEFKEDLVLGLYKLTSSTEDGKARVYECIPKSIHARMKKYIDKGLSGKVLTDMFYEMVDCLEQEELMKTINKLAKLSHNEAKIAISVVDFATAEPGDKSNPVSLMVDAGARGKWEQVYQIKSSNGFVSDVEGKIIPTPITSSLLDGLTPKEYFYSSYGGIKGLIDTARNTASSGYLTRRLIYVVSPLELHPTLWDCGSDKYIEVDLTSENINNYLYRVIKLDPKSEEIIITKPNAMSFIGKKVYMRSPLTCKAEGKMICHKCYGYLFKKHHSRSIGYIAAQSIGERASQLTLRTKHISGVMDLKLPEWIKIDNGHIITSVPTVIYVTPDGVNICTDTEKEEFDLPYAAIEVTAPHAVTETVDEIKVDDDEESVITTKYTIQDVGDIANITLKSHDVVTAVGEFSRLIRLLPDRVGKYTPISEVLKELIGQLGFNKIHSVHYELLLSMFCRNKDDEHSLHRHYLNNAHSWIKEKEVLDHMMVQSMIFERFNQKLPKLLTMEADTANWDDSIFSQLTTFNFADKHIYSDPLVNIFN